MFFVLQLLRCMRALRSASFLCFFLACSFVSSKSVADESYVQLNDDDLLILQLAIDTYEDDEPLFVYHSPELTLIPISNVSSILELAIDADVDEQFVSGWVGQEGNTLEMDLGNNTFYLGGVAQPWDTQTRFADDGFDLYLDQQTVQRLLGLKFEIDVAQLELRLPKDSDVPLLAKLARQKKREQIVTRELEQIPENYIPNKYTWWSQPQFDFSLGEEFENTRGHFDSRYSMVLQGRADLAKHSLTTSFIDNDGESDLRLTLSRASEGPDKHMLLGLDRYELGDVTGLSDPLLFSSVQGRGARLSRGGNAILEQGDVIDLQGDAPPGWEVELYRNGSLVEFSETSSDGRYTFDQVPIYIGENIFDIRLYGPQGQFREVREVISTGGSMLKAGQWEYDTWLMQRNKRLINSTINSNTPESDFLMTEARYGINRYLSARVGLSSMTPNNNLDEYSYWFGSLYGSMFGSMVQAHYAKDDQGGSGYQFNLKTRAFQTNVNAELIHFDDLISDRNSTGTKKNELGLRMDRSFLVGLPSALLVNLEFRKREFKSGAGNFSSVLRTATGWSGFQLVNDLTYLDRDSVDARDVNGLFSVTRKWDGWRYKGGIEYSVRPSSSLRAITFGASHKFRANMTYSGSVSHRFEGDDEFSSDNTLTWGFDQFSVSANAGFNTDGYQYVGVSFNTSLGYDAYHEDHFFSADSYLNNASIAARVFIDENNNKLYDDGEQPVERVRFKGKSKWRQYQTDDQGLVVLNDVEHLSLEKLEIEERSLEDPFVQPSQGAMYVYTHAGANVRLDVPLVMTFELEGSLSYRNKAEQVALHSVRVHLLDDAGKEIAVVRSEFDGVYLFEGLLPGSYCVQVNPEDLTKRGLSKKENTCFSADGADGVVFIDELAF